MDWKPACSQILPAHPKYPGDPRGSQAVLPLRYSAQGNSAMRRHSPRRYCVQIVSYAWGSRWRQQWGIHKNPLNQSWPWTMDIHGKCSWENNGHEVIIIREMLNIWDFNMCSGMFRVHHGIYIYTLPFTGPCTSWHAFSLKPVPSVKARGSCPA